MIFFFFFLIMKTHSSVINFFFLVLRDASHTSLNHKTYLSPPPLAAQILFICSLTRGVFSFTFFAAVGDVILHMFSILHLRVRDLGRTTGALWLSVLLSPDYFAFLFFLFSLLQSGKKIRFIFSFDLQDHGRKYVFEK